MCAILLRSSTEVFAREVLATLPLLKLLDSYFHLLPIDINTSLRTAATAYLERRVLNERHRGAPALLRIRSVAARLCQESVDGRSEQDYVTQLCSLALETCRPRRDEIWAASTAVSGREPTLCSNDLESDVYIAALYTNTLPVVSEWIASGKELGKRSLLFGDARCHAARFSEHKILAAMMESPYEDTFQRLRFYFLLKTAEFGRVAATRFTFSFQATERPWAFSRKRSRPSYPFSNEQGLARIHTPNPEIFDYLMEKRKAHCPSQSYGAKEWTAFLMHCAKNGWVDMAARYLALGASVDGLKSCGYDGEQRPLVVACQNGQRGVVRTLLAYGADTSRPALEVAVRYGHFAIVLLLLQHNAEVGEAVAEGVAKGYKTTVQVLLEHRASGKLEWQRLLVRAVELEDEGLLQLLAGQVGEEVREAAWDKCMKMAQEEGLESMVKMMLSQAVAGARKRASAETRL